MTHSSFWPTALIALSFASCNSGAVYCPQSLTPPIFVEVRDHETGAPAAQGASGWIKKDNFTSPLLPAQPSEPLVLASSGGPGIYDVVVQKTNYVTWTRNSVFVAGGKCGVNKSVVLHADLERSP